MKYDSDGYINIDIDDDDTMTSIYIYDAIMIDCFDNASSRHYRLDFCRDPNAEPNRSLNHDCFGDDDDAKARAVDAPIGGRT